MKYGKIFTSNLDDVQRDILQLNREANTTVGLDMPVPQKGDCIEVPFQMDGKNFFYELEVKRVIHNYDRGNVRIELHIPTGHFSQTLGDWITWFNRFRFGRV